MQEPLLAVAILVLLYHNPKVTLLLPYLEDHTYGRLFLVKDLLLMHRTAADKYFRLPHRTNDA